MLYFNHSVTQNDTDRWKAHTHLVHYVKGAETHQAYTSDLQWWQSFEDKWDMTIVTVDDVELTPAQVNRLSEVQDIDEVHMDDVITYVKNGTFPAGDTHGLRNLQLTKENTELKLAIAELGMMMLGGME